MKILNYFFCMNGRFRFLSIVLIAVISLFVVILELEWFATDKNAVELLNQIPESSLSSANKSREYLSACQNKVLRSGYNHSVWTMLTDGAQYAKSAIKLLKSIKQNTNIKFDAIILTLTNRRTIKKSIRDQLELAGWQFCLVDRIAPRDEKNTHFTFRDQFTKLQLWKMIEYESVIYLDSDCFVIKNIDYMFRVHTKFGDKFKIGVARDIREGEMVSTFNMGVFVLKPNLTEFDVLLQFKNDSNFKFDMKMSEQGFLNEVYRSKWFDIGFEYNANLAAYLAQPEHWDSREANISIVHFTVSKPWSCGVEFKHLCNLWRNISLS